jgi:hypothetical protein
MMITLEDIWEHEGFQKILAEMRNDLISTWERSAPADIDGQHMLKLQMVALERFRGKLEAAIRPARPLNNPSASGKQR